MFASVIRCPVILKFPVFLTDRIGVSSIYLILRPKRDMSPRDRIDKICSGAVSDRALFFFSVFIFLSHGTSFHFRFCFGGSLGVRTHS